MADIASYPLIHHLRAEPTTHVLRYRRGRLVADGPGLAFWFRPIHTAVAEVPIDDRELPFLFHVRSADFQELTVQGAVSFRVADAGRLARRVDFSLDLDSGRWAQAPLEQVAALLTQLAQQFVIDELVRTDLRTILAGGVAPIRDRIAAGLRAEPALQELGIDVVAVRVAAVSPSAEVEKALRAPTRERIHEQADEATFARRAQAVDKERAIAENELQNRIELAGREEGLVEQERENQRRRAEAQAEQTDVIEAANLRAERERAEIQASVPPPVLLALALQELAGQLGHIDHLTITPDLVTPLLANLQNGAAPKGSTVGAAPKGSTGEAAAKRSGSSGPEDRAAAEGER